MQRPIPNAIRVFILALLSLIPITASRATTVIALRSRYRVVLAADSRAIYSVSGAVSECKLFEMGDVYATVSGFAHHGRAYRATDAVKDGFAAPGTFQRHIASTAFLLQSRVQRFLANLERGNPAEYRSLMRRTAGPADFVQLAVAQTNQGQPMLGIVELQRAGANSFRTKTMVCPGNCSRSDAIYYLGYWERIKPYVDDAAAADDRVGCFHRPAHPYGNRRASRRSRWADQHPGTHQLGRALARGRRELLVAGRELVAPPAWRGHICRAAPRATIVATNARAKS